MEPRERFGCAAYSETVYPVFPCLFALLLGWTIWNRWLAAAATILMWAIFLLPFAVGSSLGSPMKDPLIWAIWGVSFGLSIFLTELGVTLRDVFECNGKSFSVLVKRR